MAWFKKKDKVIDLGQKYREQQAAQAQAKRLQNQDAPQTMQTSQASSTGSTGSGFAGFGIFDSGSENTNSTGAENTNSNEDFVDLGDAVGSRRKRLAKRIVDMTSKMENLSNELYHLQQRIEVLERKLDVGRY